MRLVTYLNENGVLTPGIELERCKVLNLTKASDGKITSIMQLIQEENWKDTVAQLLQSKLNEVEIINETSYRAPIYASDKFLGVALNYKDFCDRGNLSLPTTLKIFGKYQSALNYDGGTFDIQGQKCTYEGELGVVIGKECRNVKANKATEYILGYTIINDFSANNLIKEDIQLFRGKNLDGAFPFGPVIATKDEIENPMKLHIKTIVDGEVRQDSCTENMVFDIYDQIEYFSSFMTLKPGDIIATGTPAGTALQFNPPRFVQPGQKIEVSIEQIGSLIITVK